MVPPIFFTTNKDRAFKWAQQKATLNLLLVIALILFFGFIPHSFFYRNQVKWSTNPDGLLFFGRGIAYSLRPFLIFQDDRSNPEGFSLEIALKSSGLPGLHLLGILAFYSPDFPEFSILLAQWHADLIIRRGGKSFNSGDKAFEELEGQNAFTQGTRVVVTLVSDNSNGTKIYRNGIKIKEYPQVSINSRKQPTAAHLVLGNSPDGTHPWIGAFYGLAVYAQSLTPERVFKNFKLWESQSIPTLKQIEGLKALYLFNQGKGALVENLADSQGFLHIPPRFTVLQKKILAPIRDDFEWTLSYFGDVLINVLGFVPFGLFLSAFLSSRFPAKKIRLSILVIAMGGLLSLGIELAQVLIPARFSSMTDLIGNILGTAIGGMIFRRLPQL
jgi:hypothetical protein